MKRNDGENMGRKEFSTELVGVKISTSAMGMGVEAPQKRRNRITSDLCIPLLDIFLRTVQDSISH